MNSAIERPLHLRFTHGLSRRHNWLQLARFGAVGATGYVVNLVAFAACVHTVGIDYTPSAVIAWLISVLNNFTLNRYWTFGAKRPRPFVQGVRFFAVSALVFGFTYLVLVALVSGLGVATVPAQALAVAAGTPLNFLGQKLWSFNGASRPDPPAHTAIELRDVSKRYGAVSPVQALRDVSLAIEHGELVSIVGPSGSGKTTLLHVMGALLRPSNGTVRIGGTATSSLTDRALSSLRAYRLGFVFQDYVLIAGASALENVADGLLYCGVSRRERPRREREALDRVALAPRTIHLPAQLSGGERQRVAIARALVGNPSLALADEPTGNLDSRTADAILELLVQLNNEGVTIAIITHDPDVAAAAPRTIELRDGTVIADRDTMAAEARHG